MLSKCLKSFVVMMFIVSVSPWAYAQEKLDPPPPAELLSQIADFLPDLGGPAAPPPVKKKTRATPKGNPDPVPQVDVEVKVTPQAPPAAPPTAPVAPAVVQPDPYLPYVQKKVALEGQMKTIDADILGLKDRAKQHDLEVQATSRNLTSIGNALKDLKDLPDLNALRNAEMEAEKVLVAAVAAKTTAPDSEEAIKAHAIAKSAYREAENKLLAGQNQDRDVKKKIVDTFSLNANEDLAGQLATKERELKEKLLLLQSCTFSRDLAALREERRDLIAEMTLLYTQLNFETGLENGPKLDRIASNVQDMKIALHAQNNIMIEKLTAAAGHLESGREEVKEGLAAIRKIVDRAPDNAALQEQANQMLQKVEEAVRKEAEKAKFQNAPPPPAVSQTTGTVRNVLQNNQPVVHYGQPVYYYGQQCNTGNCGRR